MFWPESRSQVHPLTPPPFVTALEDPFAIERAAAYVALIPFLTDTQMFGDLNVQDLWCNSAEFLDIGAGDWEEHATLLCNFFNAIDDFRARAFSDYGTVKSYVLIGDAVPEGESMSRRAW